MIDTLRSIVRQFGGLEDVIAISVFVFSFFLICSLIKRKTLRFSIALILSVFMLAQLISLYFSQSFVGYQFFVHLNIKGTEGLIHLYIPQVIIAIILFTMMLFIFYKSKMIMRFIQQKFLKRFHENILKKISWGLIAISFLFLMIKSDFIACTKTLLPIVTSHEAFKESNNFNKVLLKNGMQDYTLPESVTCTKGKNIIVLSLESLERGFLHRKHKVLTPNLRRLKEQWNYIDIEQNNGSEWTSGALYTTLTGFPAYFGVKGNDVFQTAYHSKINSISKALQTAGYQTIFMNGNTNFSGTKEMLHALSFDKVIDKFNVAGLETESRYGIRDKDLFELAKDEVLKLNTAQTPYMLYLSTTDTHFPDGIYDVRMEEFISEKASGFEFMVAALDYLVGDFVTFLEKNNLLDNTAVFILPDHIKMGDPSMFDYTGERGLYVISNTDKGYRSFTEKDTVLYQIELPKIIMNGAETKHNLKFYTDYIPRDKNDYIYRNISTITEINTNGLLRIGEEPETVMKISDSYQEYKKDTLRYIAHGGGEIKGAKYTNSLEAMDLSYKNGLRLIELDIIKTSDNQYVAAHDWKHWKKITDWNKQTPVSKELFLAQKILDSFTPMDMDRINKWFVEHPDAILVTDKVNDPIDFSKKFVAKDRLMMEVFDRKAVNDGLKANIKAVIPSENVIIDMSKDELKEWVNKGIEYIAIPRTFIHDENEKLQMMLALGLKPYAYHINFKKGIDEEYVVKYEMDAIYGIYVDKWSFD